MSKAFTHATSPYYCTACRSNICADRNAWTSVTNQCVAPQLAAQPASKSRHICDGIPSTVQPCHQQSHVNLLRLHTIYLCSLPSLATTCPGLNLDVDRTYARALSSSHQHTTTVPRSKLLHRCSRLTARARCTPISAPRRTRPPGARQARPRWPCATSTGSSRRTRWLSGAAWAPAWFRLGSCCGKTGSPHQAPSTRCRMR
mmetsp:Transcript_12398/g.30453  ORF Transcript_12398/g.30453 Transcript_12398/m.30453 type:complete len:201 (+) Transcript_12398:2-604(+)